MQQESFMYRCLQLAKSAAGNVGPNPMVGAVLVHNDQVIGEGLHEIFGGPHAEVNAITEAINNGHEKLISQSVLYVSLEPCSHYGKTPPCTDLIIQQRIPKVVIGCRDPFPEVNGKGVLQLKTAGIEVVEGVLEENCSDLNKRFFVFQKQHRPYIILKWAETGDGKIGSGSDEKLKISNELTNRLVHKWRSEEAAILVGTNTALLDDPQLTTRFWKGNNPIRLVVDLELKLPLSLNMFNGSARTIVFNALRHEEDNDLLYYQVTKETSLVQQILNALQQLNIQSMIVEGGARLLQSFIDEGMWDEARVIKNYELRFTNGVVAPRLKGEKKISEKQLLSDQVTFFGKAD